MLYDKLISLDAYASVIPGFPVIRAFLAEHDPLTLAPGAVELGDGIRAVTHVYDSREGGEFEVHRKYLDLQYIVSGGERIQVAHLSGLTEGGAYSEQDDIQFFKKAETITTLNMAPGCFAVFYPWDGHKPNLHFAEGPAQVRKVVFKIPAPVFPFPA